MYRILNWNTGLTEKQDNYKKIFEFIEKFLEGEKEGENTIAVLQQIPYKCKNSEGQWVFSDIYNKFLESFPEKNYKIFHNTNYHSGYIFMLTVIVVKTTLEPKTLELKLKVEDANREVYPKECLTNREVAININNEYKLLGLHAKNGEDNLKYIKSINGEADIIVGDFNAGDYPEYSNWATFRTILPTHICVCSIPTKRVENEEGKLIRETCIDHVYIKRESITRCTNVIVHREIKLSDHYPITFCICKREKNPDITRINQTV